MTDFTAALEEARNYAAQSYAQNTRLAYANDWKLFKAWCSEHQRRALPATPETILGYIVALSRQVSVATIDRRLCGIAFYHRQERMGDPTEDPEVVITLRGLRRAKGTAPAAKAPITTPLLQQLVRRLDESPRDLQARAVLLLGFAGAFRRSELVALEMEDLTFVPEGAVVLVQRSKTDQEGIGLRKGIPRGEHGELCPVRALQQWLEAAKIREGRVFRTIDGRGQVQAQPLPGYTVARLIKRLVKQEGLEPQRYGGHSLRAGFVTAAVQAGVSERLIMQQTGHTDIRTLRRYIRDGSLFRENAAAQVGL